MFNKNIFSERIRSLRIAMEVTQSEVAEVVGITNKAISMMEKGERAASIEVLGALSRYFGVSSDYLIGLTDNPEVPDEHVFPKFPGRLKKLRIDKGLSEWDMESHLEISVRNYVGYEAGEVMPPLTFLCALADFFDVSLDYLIGRTDNP